MCSKPRPVRLPKTKNRYAEVFELQSVQSVPLLLHILATEVSSLALTYSLPPSKTPSVTFYCSTSSMFQQFAHKKSVPLNLLYLAKYRVASRKDLGLLAVNPFLIYQC